MENGFLVLDEKDWKDASAEQRDWMVYKTLKSMDSRLKKLERRSVVHNCFSFVGGVIGGILAAIGIKFGGHS
jgi:hypothetical protein